MLISPQYLINCSNFSFVLLHKISSASTGGPSPDGQTLLSYAGAAAANLTSTDHAGTSS